MPLSTANKESSPFNAFLLPGFNPVRKVHAPPGDPTLIQDHLQVAF
jgi:hypothetical protein